VVSSEENLRSISIVILFLILVGGFALYFSTMNLDPIIATHPDEDVGRVSIEFLWDYTIRGTDTLMQMAVLFAAVLGITSQFRRMKRNGDHNGG